MCMTVALTMIYGKQTSNKGHVFRLFIVHNETTCEINNEHDGILGPK